ncbi:MAG: MFS transporter, partial [Armatimonadota bacterium]|nr:MFS transporter [Armatimonadota bacterium]
MPHYRRNLYILCVAIFLASVSWFQVMPFLPLFLGELGVPKDALLKWSGIVFSAQSLASIVALPFWGKLGDRFGRKPMTLRAGFCLGMIYFGMSVCREPWQLAVFRFLNGALTGFIPGAVALIATGTPKHEVPRAVATAQTASAVGQIVGPAIGGFLAEVFGYRGSMHLSGMAVLASTLMVWVFVQEKARPEKEEKTRLVEDFLFAFRSPVLTSIMLVVLVNGFFIAAVNPILALHIRKMSADAPDWLAGVIFSLPAVAFVLFARRWALIGERIGYQRTIALGLGGGAIGSLALAGVHRVSLFAALFFLLGACVAALAPSSGAVIALRVPEGFHGRAYAMQSSAIMLGGLIAPVAATQAAARLGVASVFIGTAFLYLCALFAFRALARRWEAKTGDNHPVHPSTPGVAL